MLFKSTIFGCMTNSPRLLQVQQLDNLDSNLLDKVVDFYKRDFPSHLVKTIDSNFFTCKIGHANPNGSGYFTVATFDDQVIGTCTATRKTLFVLDRLIDVVEIGDTFTSPNFRKDCMFKELFHGTISEDDYLNKSVFGRLVAETLLRARNEGVKYVYGTPNLASKLPYLKRMGFQLVDDGFTMRISCPSRDHPSFKSLGLFYKVAIFYIKISRILSLLRTRHYRLEFISERHLISFPQNWHLDGPKGVVSISNHAEWIEARYIKNTDKKYEIIKVVSKRNGSICGYLFFMKQTRTDGFKILIMSKALFASRRMLRIKMQLSRIAADSFFEYQNMSLWVDTRECSSSTRILYGYLSRKEKVDIVSKVLSDQFSWLKALNFYNFDYGDSDLG